jgi:hypothetical protein
MLYANNAIRDCSVQMIEMSQFLWSPVEDQVGHLNFMTGANEYLGVDWMQHFCRAVFRRFDLSRSRNACRYTQGLDSGTSSHSPTPGPLNFTDSRKVWNDVLLGLTDQAAPVGKLSFFHVSVVANQLAYLRIVYYGESL